MTPDKNFRMKKSYKTMLALLKGTADQRHGWKHTFIDAQLHEESAKRAAMKSKDNDGRSRGAVAPD